MRLLMQRWCLIHATQMLPAETLGLAATGAVAGLCPITEANLGDGIFDGVRFLGAGGRFGVGSDSNVRISLTEELRLLEYSQRLRDRGRAMLATTDRSTGRVLFEGATKGGARRLGAVQEGLRLGNGPTFWRLDMTAVDLGWAARAMTYWMRGFLRVMIGWSVMSGPRGGRWCAMVGIGA